MKLRIVKYGDENFGIERKGLFSWHCVHTTPGYPTKESAVEGLRRYINPEVVCVHEVNDERSGAGKMGILYRNLETGDGDMLHDLHPLLKDIVRRIDQLEKERNRRSGMNAS